MNIISTDDGKKLFVTPTDMWFYSYSLAAKVWKDFKPDTIVAIEVGALGIAQRIIDFMRRKNQEPKFISVKVRTYKDIRKRSEPFTEKLKRAVCYLKTTHAKNILLVDDVVDTGWTMGYLKDFLEKNLSRTVKTATVFVKVPQEHYPDFYIIEVPSDVWIHFPDDLCETKKEYIKEWFPKLVEIFGEQNGCI